MNIKEAIDQEKILGYQICDYENVIRNIRGTLDWEKGIETDTRGSVQLLYSALINARKEYKKFISQEIILSNDKTEIL